MADWNRIFYCSKLHESRKVLNKGRIMYEMFPRIWCVNFGQWWQWVIREGTAWSCGGEATIASRIHAVFVEQWPVIQWVLLEAVSWILLDRRCWLLWQGWLSLYHDKNRRRYSGSWSQIVHCSNGGVSSCSWLFVRGNCGRFKWWLKRSASIWSHCVEGWSVNREGNHIQATGANCVIEDRTNCMSQSLFSCD